MDKRSPLSAQDEAYLIRRKEAGASHQAVANELQCAWETVRKHWQRHRHGRVAGKRGRPQRGVLSTYPPNLRAKLSGLMPVLRTTLRRVPTPWSSAPSVLAISTLSDSPIWAIRVVCSVRLRRPGCRT